MAVIDKLIKAGLDSVGLMKPKDVPKPELIEGANRTRHLPKEKRFTKEEWQEELDSIKDFHRDGIPGKWLKSAAVAGTVTGTTVASGGELEDAGMDEEASDLGYNLSDFTGEEGAKGYEESDFMAVPTEKFQWNHKAARQHAGKVLAADGQFDDELIKQYAGEIVAHGSSPELENIKRAFLTENQDDRIRGTAGLVKEFGTDNALSVFTGKPLKDAYKDLNDRARDSIVSQVSPETKVIANLNKEAYYQKQYRKEYEAQVRGKWEDSTFSNVVDSLATFIPEYEERAIHKLGNYLQEKFQIEADKGYSYITMGTRRQALSHAIERLPYNERLVVMKATMDWARENTGIFGGNEAIRMDLLAKVFDPDNLNATEEEAYLDATDTTNWDKHVNNAVSVLDAATLGLTGIPRKIVSKAWGGVRGLVGSSPDDAIEIAKRSSPEAGGSMHAEGIIDTSGETAEAMDTTRADLVAELTVKWGGDGSEDMPGVSAEWIMAQVDSQMNVLSRNRDMGLNLSKAERDLQEKAIIERATHKVVSHPDTDGVVWTNASVIKRDDSGVDVTIVVGKDETAGFSSLREAQMYASKLGDKSSGVVADIIVKGFGNKGTVLDSKGIELHSKPIPKRRTVDFTEAEIEAQEVAHQDAIVKSIDEEIGLLSKSDNTDLVKYELDRLVKDRDLVKTGQVDEMSTESKIKHIDDEPAYAKETMDDPEDFTYFVQIKSKEQYSNTSHVEFDADDVLPLSGPLRLITDIRGALSKAISGQINTAYNRAEGTKTDLFNMLNPLFKNTEGKKVATKSRKRALDLLFRGSRDGKEFTPEEIIGRYASNDVSAKDIQETMEAYYSVRNHFNFSRRIRADQLYNNLLQEGKSHIRIGDTWTTGRTITRQTAYDKARIYDGDGVRGVGARSMTKDEIDEIYNSGGSIVKSDVLHGDRHLSHYVVIKNGKDAIRPLMRDKIISDIPGYIPRIYDSPYYIVAKLNNGTIDGQSLASPGNANIFTKTIGTASSPEEAKEYMKRLKESGDFDDWELNFKVAREKNDSSVADYFKTIESNHGKLFYGKRGNHLKDLQGKLSETEDLVYSLQASVSSVSRKIDFDPVIELQKARWINTYGKHLTNGQWPADLSKIGSEAQGNTKLVHEARTAWHYINNSTNASIDSEKWRQRMFSIGEFLTGSVGLPKAGKAFQGKKAGSLNPIGKLRSATFFHLILGNPARQLLLNAHQSTLYAALDPKYILTGKAHVQGWHLMRAINNPDRMDHFAKSSGMDVKEFKELAEHLKSTGLIDSISNHQFMRDSMSYLEAQMKANSGEVISKTTSLGVSKASDFLGKYGFAKGEEYNRVISYLVAKRRLEKEGKVWNQDAETLRKLEDEADVLTLSMGRPGSYVYQDGWLSIPTQFLSFQNKVAGATWFRAGGGKAGQLGNKGFTPEESRRMMIAQTGIYGLEGLGIYEVYAAARDYFGWDISSEGESMVRGGIYDATMNGILNLATNEHNNVNFSATIAPASGYIDMLGNYRDALFNGDKMVWEIASGPSDTLFSRYGSMFKNVGHIMGYGSGDPSVDEKLLASAVTELPRVLSGYNQAAKASVMLRARDGDIRWLKNNYEQTGAKATTAEALLYGAFGFTDKDLEAYYDLWNDDKKWKKMIKDTSQDYHNRLMQVYAKFPEASEMTGSELELLDRLVATEALAITENFSGRDQKAIFDGLKKLRSNVQKGHQSSLDQVLYKHAGSGDMGNDTMKYLKNANRKSQAIPEGEMQKLEEFFKQAYEKEESE